MNVYYNEIEEFPCKVIAKNIERGHLPPGKIDCRDIRLVKPDDIAGFRQVHLFAGIGGAAYAGRLAGIRDELNVWTGGFPCQDISCAGKGKGIQKGTRSGLWREMFRLIRNNRPDWVLIENVPALRTRGCDRVCAALERIGYSTWQAVVGAWAVGAPQKRCRVWIVATRVFPNIKCGIGSLEWRSKGIGGIVKPLAGGWPSPPGVPQCEWENMRLIELPVGGTVDGVSTRVLRSRNKLALKAYGNSWVPQVGALFLKWIDWADQQRCV